MIANASNPMQEAAMKPPTMESERGRMIWGLSLHGWEDVMRGSLAIVGVFGLVVGLATFFVVKLQREEIAASKDDFDRYKLETTARTKEAELKLEQLRKQTAARHINAQEFSKLISDSPKLSVEIMFPRGDGEAFQLALEIRNGLRLAHWDAREPAPIPLPQIPQLAQLPSAMSAGGQPSGVAVVAHEITQEEIDRMEPWPKQYATAFKSPFLTLHNALLASLGTLSASGGHLNAPPEGLLRIVVGPHPLPQ